MNGLLSKTKTIEVVKSREECKELPAGDIEMRKEIRVSISSVEEQVEMMCRGAAMLD